MDSSRLKRKTIYSPVDLRSSLDLEPIEKHPTLAKLRYLDDTTDEDDLRFGRGHTVRDAAVPSFEKCTNTRSSREPGPQQQQQQQQQLSRHTNEDTRQSSTESDEQISDQHDRQPYNRQDQHQDDSASLEEVYLCSCCGVTKPLDPAMKFMPLFRSLFLLFNFLVFAFGLAGLGMGLWFRIDPKVYEIHKYIETQNFTLAGWIMLFAGFTACLMALIAFASISKHSICLLVFYSVIMALLTVSSIGSLVLLTVYGLGEPLERFMSKEIYEQIRRRTMSTELDLSTSSDAAQFLDFVQVKVSCCAVRY
jgi:cation transport ATPase